MSAAGTLFKAGRCTEQFYATRWDLAAEVVGMLRRRSTPSLPRVVSTEIEASPPRACCVHTARLPADYVERVTDATVRARMIADGEDPKTSTSTGSSSVTTTVLDAARATGVTVGLHMCRGNNRSAWHAEGSYEAMAESLQRPRVDRFLLKFSGLTDRFLLEYDTERRLSANPSGSCPREYVTVVLGIECEQLQGARQAGVEHVQGQNDAVVILARIDEASRYVRRRPRDFAPVRLRVHPVGQPPHLGRPRVVAGSWSCVAWRLTWPEPSGASPPTAPPPPPP